MVEWNPTLLTIMFNVNALIIPIDTEFHNKKSQFIKSVPSSSACIHLTTTFHVAPAHAPIVDARVT